MTSEKEIRANSLPYLHPDPEELEKMLSNLERVRPNVNVMYELGNPKDPTCMVIKLGLMVIGYVNADDKKYVEPLLRETGMCEAEFYEVYREENCVPVVRFLITVDLAEVKPLVAGEGWKEWSYTFPRLMMLEELSTVEYTGHLLKDWLQKKKECEYTSLKELVETFVNASLFDMSIETSNTYDDLLFFLETSRNRNRPLINRLQRGCTVRRTDRYRNRFLKEWWPQFMSGELVKRLCNDFTTRLEKNNLTVTDELITEEYNKLVMEMRALPMNLYNNIDNLGAFWACLYYTKVPKNKFIEVLSGIVLYTKLKACIDNKIPFVIKEEHRHYYQLFSGGENMLNNF